MPDPKTPCATDAIDLLLHHHWPRAAQDHTFAAAHEGRLDPIARERLDLRIAACNETPVNRRHEVLGIAHGSIVSTLQLMPLTAEDEMRAASNRRFAGSRSRRRPSATAAAHIVRTRSSIVSAALISSTPRCTPVSCMTSLPSTMMANWYWSAPTRSSCTNAISTISRQPGSGFRRPA